MKSIIVVLSLLLCISATAPNTCLADYRITNNVSDSSDPSVGAGPDGLARLAWSDNAGGVYQIYWATSDRTGNILYGPVQITTSAAHSVTPRISVDGSNRSFIIWKESGLIYFARVGSTGTIEVAPVRVSSTTSTCDTPDLDTAPDGTSHIVYRQRSGLIHYMRYRVITEAGGLIREISPGNFDAAGENKYPAVALDPAGNAYMSWHDIYYYRALYRAAYTPTGAVLEGVAKIVNGEQMSYSAIVATGYHNYQIVYQDGRTGTQRIYGYPDPDPISPAPGPTTRPRAAGAEGYPLYVVWQDYDGGTWGVEAMRLDGNGEYPGVVQISDSPGNATIPDIDTDGHGHYYIVWKDDRDGNGEIYLESSSDPVGIRVTVQVRSEHDSGPFITPPPPLPGVTVSAAGGLVEWTDATDDSGIVIFQAEDEFEPGDAFELSLTGPHYEVAAIDKYQAGSIPTETVLLSAFGPITDYQWQHGDALNRGAALQAAYFNEKFRNDYLWDVLGYEWTLPTSRGRPDNRVGVQIFERDYVTAGGETSLGKLGGAALFESHLGFNYLRHRGEEADIFYHEYMHVVIADLICVHHPSFCEEEKPQLDLGCEADDEGRGIEEALADYFSASFTCDPAIARCSKYSDWPYDESACESPLRMIDREPMTYPYPRDDVDFGAYEKSLYLSSALWYLRSLIDGDPEAPAPITDHLVFQALNSMIAGKNYTTRPTYEFSDFYQAIKDVDMNEGGLHADQIEAAFQRNNLGSSPQNYEPPSWVDNIAILSSVVEVGEITINWIRAQGAARYNILIQMLFEYSDCPECVPALGRYITIATGIEDTTYTMPRNTNEEFMIAVVPVDSAGQCGYTSLPVYVDVYTSSEIDENAAKGGGTVPAGKILSNYPNPFNPQTTISFEISKRDKVKFSIFDVKGSKIRDLIERDYEAGHYSIVWDGSNNRGMHVSSGQYFLLMEGTEWRSTRKILLLR